MASNSPDAETEVGSIGQSEWSLRVVFAGAAFVAVWYLVLILCPELTRSSARWFPTRLRMRVEYDPVTGSCKLANTLWQISPA